MIEKILKEINRLKNELDGYSALEALDYIESYINTLPEESASEGLIEEIDKIWKTCNPIDEGMGVETANIHIEQFDDIARQFAEWQKNKMKEALQTEYEKGRFDMREEMMKALVNSEIVKDIHNQLSVKSEPLNDTFRDIKFGDKVKIIIVKEN